MDNNMDGLVWVNEKVWGRDKLLSNYFKGSEKEMKKLIKYYEFLGFCCNWTVSLVNKNVWNNNVLYIDDNFIFLKDAKEVVEYFEISNIIFDKKWEQDYEFNLAADENMKLNDALDSSLSDIIYHYKPTESNKGYKDSSNKLLTYELDASFIKEMAKVMSVNKTNWGGKYEEGNHYKPINPIELLSSLERHFLEVKEYFQSGNVKDLIDDDYCSHLVKVSTNAMMLWIQLNKVKNGDT